MAVWPSTVRPIVGGYSAEEEEFLRRNVSEDGTLQIRDIWGRTRLQAALTLELATDTTSKDFWAFWRASRTSQFVFFNFLETWRAGVACGTGTGALSTFTIPARAVRGETVYVAGVPEDDYTLSVGTGTNGEDRILFDAPPALGLAVTVDCFCEYRHNARFSGTPRGEVIGFRRERVRVNVIEDFG
jgi:hypothetical protein